MSSGYISCKSDEFVSDENAFEYALDKVLNDEKERKEFEEYLRDLYLHNNEEKHQFVEWFFSGNWIREKEK